MALKIIFTLVFLNFYLTWRQRKAEWTFTDGSGVSRERYFCPKSYCLLFQRAWENLEGNYTPMYCVWVRKRSQLPSTIARVFVAFLSFLAEFLSFFLLAWSLPFCLILVIDNMFIFLFFFESSDVKSMPLPDPSLFWCFETDKGGWPLADDWAGDGCGGDDELLDSPPLTVGSTAVISSSWPVLLPQIVWMDGASTTFPLGLFCLTC